MEEAPISCANCGKAEEVEAKLRACNACKLVKYCGRDCQSADLPQHKTACRKRAAELKLYDEALFRQPLNRGDCPICFLRLPALASGIVFVACCGKTICNGCRHAHELQSTGSPTCPFCRASRPSAKQFIKMLEKRVDANNADAILMLGDIYLRGDKRFGIKRDFNRAVKLIESAAKLGSVQAFHNLGIIYNKELASMSTAKQYSENAAIMGAIAGCIDSRLNLGFMDANTGSFDRAIKHWLIGASCGDIRAVNCIKKAMTGGNATRDDYARALRGYTQYLDEVRSYQRDRAAAYSDENKYLLA
jgi:hypothetical protein